MISTCTQFKLRLGGCILNCFVVKRLTFVMMSSAWNQEPNDYKGDEDCGVIKSNGYFNDVSCSTTKAPAICELDNTSKES